MLIVKHFLISHDRSYLPFLCIHCLLLFDTVNFGAVLQNCYVCFFLSSYKPLFLDCHSYTWKRNLIEFNPSGNDDRVVQLANVGTIVITKPEDKDEGIFQCFAKNSFGTSLSININLREAKLKVIAVY